jgi:hypothetical protein
MSVSRGWVVGMVLLSAAGLVGCADQDQSKKASHLTCEQRESRDYPALEKVATTTLGGQRHTLARAGACEDTGSPRATVRATVQQWDSRAAGVQFLKQHGWHDYRGGLLLTDDKKYAAESSESRAADAQTSVVVLTFTRFVDDN